MLIQTGATNSYIQIHTVDTFFNLINSSGQKYTRDQAKEISRKWLATYIRRNAEHTEAYKEFVASGYDYAQLPRYPLRLLPKT